MIYVLKLNNYSLVEKSDKERERHFCYHILLLQGRSQDFSKRGGGHRGYSPAALPRVSAGSVVLLRHEGPY